MGTKHNSCPTESIEGLLQEFGVVYRVTLESQLNISSELHRTGNFEEWVKCSSHKCLFRLFLIGFCPLNTVGLKLVIQSTLHHWLRLIQAPRSLGMEEEQVQVHKQDSLIQKEVKVVWPTGPHDHSHATLPFPRTACMFAASRPEPRKSKITSSLLG